MQLVVGSRAFTVATCDRDMIQPAGEVHAVPAGVFMQDRSRAQALCGATVIAFRGVQWPALHVDLDRECRLCNAELDRR